MSKWEINLGKEWKDLGEAEVACLDKLVRDDSGTGSLDLRGQRYIYDLRAMTQTNEATKKSRKIRDNRPPPLVRAPSAAGNPNAEFALAPSTPSSGSGLPRVAAPSVAGEDPADDVWVVEVWLAGEWKKLKKEESQPIVQRQAKGEKSFVIQSRGVTYLIDLNDMTQTNQKTSRTRTIRFASATGDGGSTLGFDEFRGAFHQRFEDDKMTKVALQKTWPAEAGIVEEKLLGQTVKNCLEQMKLRGNDALDIMEWNHYWALERDSPSFHAGKEVNDKLIKTLVQDPQVLGRMQMHFETAVGSSGGLSSEGLLKACERLVNAPKNVIEKQWAAEVLQKRKNGEGPDEDAELSYYDFLNVMLGRKKYSVELWQYDISDGAAKTWSWMLLGQQFEGIWHTGVVVTWPEKRSEFWFGGALFESEPGTTPFGEPLKKIPLGHTYKLRNEVWQIVARTFASEFTKESYDVLTHNCNHFSDKLAMFLLNEHIPDEVRKQPEMVMDTLTARALRPLLNRWLGGFEDKGGRATDSGEAEQQMWNDVLPGAIILFSKEEGGRPQVGQVTDVLNEDCTIMCLDFWRGAPVELDVPRDLVIQVIEKAPAGTELPRHPTGSARLSQQQGWCSCWMTPSVSSIPVTVSR